MKRSAGRPEEPTPTQEEIRAMCLIIQSEWSEYERYRRGGRPVPVDFFEKRHRLATMQD